MWRTDLGRARYLLYAFIISGAVGLAWLGTQSYAVNRLTRGVGDTWFHTADGRRWFRLDERRHDVPIAAISPHLQHAFVAVEDHRFFLHPGVDPISLARAVARNVRERGAVQGGSTLTQQLARTLFLSNRKSYGRKAREAVLALLIEWQLSKQQILELYLNRIFLGAGIYGVEAMSQRVFGRPAKSLTLAESALIAGLARAPAALSPWSNPEEARARSHVVLARMRDEKFITEQEFRAARQAPLRIRPYRSDSGSRHGYAKAYLRQRFRDQFGGDHPPDWEVQIIDGNVHVVFPGAWNGGEIKHFGQEIGFVIEGQIELTVGEQQFRLKTGDSFFFRSSLPHSYRNTTAQICKVVWINTPPTF